MSCLNHYAHLEQGQMARQLLRNGVPDYLTRVVSWLRAFGLVSKQPHLLATQLRGFVTQLERLWRKLFTPCELEGSWRDAVIAYIKAQVNIPAKIREATRKDVMRLAPDEPFYQDPVHKTAVFRLTCGMLTQMNFEHCQGFDDLGSIMYYTAYKAVQTLFMPQRHRREQSASEPESDFRTSADLCGFLVAQLEGISQQALAEAIAYQLYLAVTSRVVSWFSDDVQDGQTLVELTRKVMDICKEISSPLHEILTKIDTPPELLVCRLSRTLFARELPMEQVVQLWDFLFLGSQDWVDERVPELSAIFFFNVLSQALAQYPDYNILDVQQHLFEPAPSTVAEGDRWRALVGQLQHITQQTSKAFDPPGFVRHKFQIETLGLRMLPKYYYEERQGLRRGDENTPQLNCPDPRLMQLQATQLDAAGCLDQLTDQLRLLCQAGTPTADLYSTLASLKYFEQMFSRFEPGNYSYRNAVVGTRFQQVVEKEIERVRQLIAGFQ